MLCSKRSFGFSSQAGTPSSSSRSKTVTPCCGWLTKRFSTRAKAEQAAGPGFDFLAGLVKDIAVRSHRRAYPGFSEAWFNLDDKWLFTHSYFDRMRHLTGASELRIRPFNNRLGPFTKHTRNCLVELCRIDGAGFPPRLGLGGAAPNSTKTHSPPT